MLSAVMFRSMGVGCIACTIRARRTVLTVGLLQALLAALPFFVTAARSSVSVIRRYANPAGNQAVIRQGAAMCL